MTYDELLIEYEDEVKVKERSLLYGFKGLYKNKKILIDSKLETDAEYCCVLSEELGHHFKTYGNILDLNDTRNLKQEITARKWGYEKLCPLSSIVQAYDKGISGRFELAEYLNVTEEFLIDAIAYYKSKYGTYYKTNNYIICFEPNFAILKRF